MPKLLFYLNVWILSLFPEKTEEPAVLLPQAVGEIQSKDLVESSGLVRSPKIPERFWSLNDSGHSPHLFALTSRGESQGSAVKVEGAKNVDWEALTTDSEGNLWIGDFGNNLNKRKDLKIYRVKEPVEELPSSVAIEHTLSFRYPDQRSFPAEKLNFDCEAMFWWENQLFLLTKHRADKDTKLYVLQDLESSELQTAVLLDRYQGIGQVTDASLSADGSFLAVLTYSGVWVFEHPERGSQFLQGKGQRFLFKNWALRQVEGICWMDGETLLICNEQKDIFHLSTEGQGWESFTGTAAESADESP